MADTMRVSKVLEQASIAEAFSGGSVRVQLFIHEELAGIKYDRKLGRWYNDNALQLLNDYPASEGWRMRVEKHPDNKWHLYPAQARYVKKRCVIKKKVDAKGTHFVIVNMTLQEVI